MKKVQRLLFLVFCLLVAGKTFAAVEIGGINYNLSEATKEASVARSSFNGELVIPDFVEVEGTVYKVTKIDPRSFINCINLTSVSIPETVTSIMAGAFQNCSGLTSVTVRGTVYISSSSFSGCSNLREFIFYKSLSNYRFLTSFRETLSKVYAPGADLGEVKSLVDPDNTGSIMLVDIDSPFVISVKERYVKGFSFNVLRNELCTRNAVLKSVSVDGRDITADKDRVYQLTGLDMETDYTVSACCAFEDKDTTITTVISTSPLNVSYDVNALYSMIKFEEIGLPVTPDPTCVVREAGIIYNGDRYKADENGTVVLSGLAADTPYTVNAYVVLESGESYTEPDKTYGTRKLLPLIQVYDLTPTTFALAMTSYYEDPGVKRELTVNGVPVEVEYGYVFMNKLLPNTSYAIDYHVYTELSSGGAFRTVNTPAIELKNVEVMNASDTKVVVSAVSNVLDGEVVMGFERRMDVSDHFSGEEVDGVCLGAKVIGVLQNLSPGTVYHCRSYYEMPDGERFYGDWMEFTTKSAYSYFAPMVFTTITNNEPFSGYVIQGSDDIIEQGFEYWKALDATEVKRMTADGQLRISATVDGLEPSTTYIYRAYVTTGTETLYGGEYKYTTPQTTGIADVFVEDGGELSVGVRCTSGQSQMEVSVSGEGEPAMFRLYTLDGTLVKAGSLLADGTWRHVDVGAPLKNKLYLLHVTHARQEKTVKFMP